MSGHHWLAWFIAFGLTFFILLEQSAILWLPWRLCLSFWWCLSCAISFGFSPCASSVWVQPPPLCHLLRLGPPPVSGYGSFTTDLPLCAEFVVACGHPSVYLLQLPRRPGRHPISCTASWVTKFGTSSCVCPTLISFYAPVTGYQGLNDVACVMSVYQYSTGEYLV